ncbi:glycosyltransferase family 2 protein, partial [Escherichia coli]|nr:glycosyltransferase family 2 protein [Escherichia coli]
SLSDNENVYFLLREDRPHYIEFVRTKNQDILLGEQNSFMSFTLKKYLKSIVNKLNKTETQEKYDSFSDSCIQIPCGPYGGMLTKKSIPSNGIRPFKDMVLYFDDTKYTYDLSLSGVKLFLLTKCFISDIDDSWSAVKTKKHHHQSLRLVSLKYHIQLEIGCFLN